MTRPPAGRPGPPRLPWGTFPGGLVIRVYGCDDLRQISETRVTWSTELERQAWLDGEYVADRLHDGESPYVVVFDGDSGERIQLLDGVFEIGEG